MAAGGSGVVSGFAAGQSCVSGVQGMPMRNFRCAPVDKIRVGIVGLGERGYCAARRLPFIPGIEIVALCDIRTWFAERCAKVIEERSGKRPVVYSGNAEVYKKLCDRPDVDVVYNCTSWNAHAPVSLYAMRAGKHTLIEVPAAMCVDECWELVETAERTKRHCMQLENCCYGEYEMLALNLCKLGMLGDLLHGEGAYLHDRRWQIFNDSSWKEVPGKRWRNYWNEKHCGNQYPTHGLGPVALDMGINRGDRFDYLVSVDGMQRGYEAFAAATLPDSNPGRAQRFAMADMNVTTIRTALGRTIMLQHDVTSPRPYSRINLIAGTKGMMRSYPHLEVCLEELDKWPKKAVHAYYDKNVTESLRVKYRHPLQKALGEIAKKAGGHGGMDFMMDLRWAYCMQRGLPLDMDVYDLASWCAICELSERSARNRSKALDIPDFTRGAWKTKCNCNLMDAEIDVSAIDFKNVGKIKGQMSV